MKKLAGNDTMEFLDFSSPGETPRCMTHNTQMCDQRADWALRLVQSWGMAATMGDILSQMGCEEHKGEIKRVPPAELVMRICEVVDAAWNELQHRGWILNVPSLEE